MKTNLLKRAFIGGLFLAAAAGIYGAYLFTLKTPTAADLKTDFTYSASDLLSAFAADAEGSNTKLLNSVIELNGTPSKLSTEGKQTAVEFDEKGTFSINVVLDSTSQVPNEGSVVKLKGKYVGFIAQDEDFGIPGEIKLNAAVVISQ